jgi:hypothetical protein
MWRYPQATSSRSGISVRHRVRIVVYQHRHTRYIEHAVGQHDRGFATADLDELFVNAVADVLKPVRFRDTS